MRKKFINGSCVLVYMLMVLLLFSGCTEKKQTELDPGNPTVVTLWHSYNAYAKAVFDELVLQFNETEGIEKGIVIDAYGFGDQDQLEDAVYNSANHIIGSEDMPNIFMAYPDSAYRIDQQTPLVSMDDYFNKEELSQYRQEFLQEGVWDNSGKYKMIPVAKSTELLYLNKTDWNKFSGATGVSIDQLQTWEGLTEVAEKYYQWSDGKVFIGFNSFNDFQMLAAAQMGNDVYVREGDTVSFQYDKEVARNIWKYCYVPHMKGWYSSEGYCQDRMKRGELIAYIGSSAGAGYFPEMVTVSEDQIYPVECQVLSYPTFENGKSYIGQRGAGMCISASDQKHEYAGAQFLKWFTEPEQNVKFAVSTGYLPVKKKSLESVKQMLTSTDGENTKAIESCLDTTLKSMNNETIHVKTVFHGSYEANATFSNSIFEKIDFDLAELQRLVKNGKDKGVAIEELIDDDHFEAWYEALMLDVSEKLKR